MTFYSSFSDVNGKRYDIEITSATLGDDVDLVMGASPVTISTSSDRLFAPIKSRSATLNIVTKKWYLDLYEPSSRGTSVKIYEYDSTQPNNVGKVIFRGYLTPCSYDQEWTYLDTIALEAVDAVSTTKDYKWQNNGQYNSFFDILIGILKSAGYRGCMYAPRAFSKINNQSVTKDVLDALYTSSTNFLDDNAERTPWTEYEVLEEVIKFLGWSLVPDGDDVWLVDYRAENAGTVTYSVYDIQTGLEQTAVSSSANPTEITLSNTAPGTTQISIDDIYNKIEISDNLYNIEDISQDIFDDGIHISITDEKGLGADGSKWTNTETKTFLWWTTSQTTTITGYDYQTICRLNPSSGWTHHYYKHTDLTELPNENGQGYYYPESDSVYTVGKINKYCNTHGCLVQHYAHRKNEGKNNLPASIDWTDILTFFVANDTTPNFNALNCDMFEKPVLEYNIGESINWKPATGTSWITIKGDLFYQYNGAKYGEKGKATLNIVNTDKHFYTTAPVDKAVDISDQKYCSLVRKNTSEDYGKGFEMWKMKLQIGDKYWNGNVWTTTPSTFYVRYNNNPDGTNDEYIPAFEWMSTVNNKNFKDKVGVDAYCIPIAATDSSAPAFGVMKLTLYTPALIPNDLLPLFKSIYKDSYVDCSWINLPPCIFCKDFEVGYVYTDTNVWWNNHEDNNDNDKVYIGYIDDNYVNDFDAIEFKINTALQDKPISRSFVTTSGGYLATMKHKQGNESKAQEYNVIDEYLDHHSERRVIFEHNMHEYFKPNEKFSKTQYYDADLGQMADTDFDGTLMIDTQSWDIRDNNNRIKFIEF